MYGNSEGFPRKILHHFPFFHGPCTSKSLPCLKGQLWHYGSFLGEAGASKVWRADGIMSSREADENPDWEWMSIYLYYLYKYILIYLEPK